MGRSSFVKRNGPYEKEDPGGSNSIAGLEFPVTSRIRVCQQC